MGASLFTGINNESTPVNYSDNQPRIYQLYGNSGLLSGNL